MGLRLEKNGTISSTDGDISVTGVAGGAGSQSFQDGLSIGFAGDVTIESTGSGNVNVVGTGGNGVTDGNGINLIGGSTIEVNTGNMTLTGTAGTNDGHGVTLGAGGLISNGIGNINVTGTGAGSDDGIRLSGGTIGGAAATGDITLTTDTIILNSTVDSDGALTIKPLTASTTIGTGGGAGTLNLDSGELGQLADGFSSHNRRRDRRNGHN